MFKNNFINPIIKVHDFKEECICKELVKKDIGLVPIGLDQNNPMVGQTCNFIK